MADFKTVPIKPLTGIFDTLTSPDEIGFGNWHIVKNATTRSTRNRQRGGGWRRLFADDFPYNNQDLHDQLTDRLGYFESFDAHAMGGGGLAGYGFPYFAPSYTVDGGVTVGPQSGPYCPVYIGDFPSGFYNGCLISNAFVGYPFVEVAGGACNTGYPSYFAYSYIYTQCSFNNPDFDYSGYGYGYGFQIYDPAFSYDYTYCGDYMFSLLGCREAVTMLQEVVTASGRKLVASTMSRLYELNQSAGNWRILADGLGNSGYTINQCGCNKVRGVSDTLGSYLLYTNNFDPPLIYLLGDEPAGCELQAATPITDLVALGITKAGGVVTWKGFTIFFDFTEDGVRMGGSVLWSDLEDPNSYIESDTSFAGRSTIAVGETILAAAELGNWLMIYTDKSIIRTSLVGGEDVFNFERVYTGGNALKYKFSLINCGDQHMYLGESDVYIFTQFDTRPINLGWITKAAGFIFNGIAESEASYLPINKDACDLVTGGWSDEKREAWLSWPTGENLCPDVTLRFNLKFNTADFVDHGFTAMMTFRADDRPTVGQWIEDMGICPRGSQVATGVKDGPVCTGEQVAVVNPPLYIRNPEEDPDLPVHPDSLCSRLIGLTIEDFCVDCASEATFITASATDFTLKQQEDDVYYRQMLGGNIVIEEAVIGSGSLLDFDGIDDRVVIPDSASLNITTALTIEAWVFSDGAASGGIFEKTVGGAANTSFLSSIAFTFLFFRLVKGAAITEIYTDAAFPVSVWTHVAGTWDGATLKLYINGVQQTATAALTAPIDTGAGESYIGQLAGGFFPFNGKIDEVRIWNVARTQTEIVAGKDRALAGTEPGLAAYWRLDENGGLSAFDATGNGNTGTLTGGPTWQPSDVFPAIPAVLISSELYDAYSCDFEFYNNQGYVTAMQTGAQDFRSTDEKIVKMIGLEAEPVAQAIPLRLQMEVGYAAQPSCMTWAAIRSLPFECLTEKTPAQHLAEHTRPDGTFYFPTFRRGVYLGARFRINGIGGAGKFSSMFQMIKGWGQQDSP